ncbi:MAG: ATP-binding cassette domain-containing protein [Myxococcota bacterium]
MIHLAGASYRYPAGVSVGPIDLVVAPGELVLLTGPTGCGKSTVLRLAAGLLQRHGHGRVGGTVTVGGHDPATLVAAQRVATLGFVGQDPDDAVVAGTCAAELAFGLESAGFAPECITARVSELLTQLGLTERAERSPFALSGGQRQKLVIGAALAAGARALLLDEPLSQLDPSGARAVMTLLRGLADEGVAVLCIEHRLEIAMPLATRTVLMDQGRVVADPLTSAGPLRALGLHGPALDELAEHTGTRIWRRRASILAPTDPPAEPPVPRETSVIHVSDVSFAWPGEPACISDVSLCISSGERVAIVGANGAGKSTLLGLVSGRLRPLRGRVTRAGRLVEVPQNPDLSLFNETVQAELAYGPVEARLHRLEVATRVAGAALALSIADLLDRPPQALSRGQRLRTAVAAALACAPRLLVLDEPTSGQDRDQVDRMLAGLPVALGGASGATPHSALLFASHDLDVVLRHATRVIVLDRGRIVGDGPPLATLRAAEANGLPLPLPPLARVCADLGVPYGDPAALLAWVEAA